MDWFALKLTISEMAKSIKTSSPFVSVVTFYKIPYSENDTYYKGVTFSGQRSIT